MILLHLILVSAWAGLVLAETVVELASRKDVAAARHAAELHYWLDVLVEGPLLAAVLGTGAVLARAWPLPAAMQVKVGAGLVAIAINLYCMVMVVRRRRVKDDPAAVERYRARVYLSTLGIPFGALAAVLGLARVL